MTTNSTITPELLDQLLANYTKPEDLTGEDGLFKQLKKALIERVGAAADCVLYAAPSWPPGPVIMRVTCAMATACGRWRASFCQ